jgi:RHS repeat-associated protein
VPLAPRVLAVAALVSAVSLTSSTAWAAVPAPDAPTASATSTVTSSSSPVGAAPQPKQVLGRSTAAVTDGTPLLSRTPDAARAGAPGQAPAAGGAAPLEAPDEASAQGLAHSSGHRVLVSGSLSPFSETYVNPNGSRTSEVSQEPQRVRRGAGWIPIDTTLTPGARLAPAASGSGTSFSATGQGTLLSVGQPGSSVSLTAPTASGSAPASSAGAPSRSGPSARYRGALGAGRDLVLQALPTGAELSVVLAARPSTAPTWRFPLTLDGLRPSGVGGRSLINAAGAVVIQVGAGTVADSAAPLADGSPAHSSELGATVQNGPAGPELMMAPSAAFLADPSTVYPVTVDPTFGTVDENFDAWINPNSTTNTDAQSVLNVGYDSGLHAGDRSLLSWNLNSLTTANATVSDATMYLWQNYAQTCASKTTTAYQVTSGWAAQTVTWANRPSGSGTPLASNTENHASGCPSALPAWVGFNSSSLTGLIQGWVNLSVSNYGVVLLSSNEADTLGGKQYLSAQNTVGQVMRPGPNGTSSFGTHGPYLSVTYTVPMPSPSPTPSPTVSPTPSPTPTPVPVAPPTVSKAIAAVTGRAGPGGTYSTGQVVRYTATVTNPAGSAQQVRLDDPMGTGIAPESGTVLLDGVACSPAAGCALNPVTGSAPSTDGLHLAALSLPAGATRTVSYQAVLSDTSDRLCSPSSNTATVTSTTGAVASSAPVTVTVCGANLGREPWWTFTGSSSTGPQGDAGVNAANGNLVLRQLDSTMVAARGHLDYVLRRTYNSQDSTALTLPGSIGAGWTLNVGSVGTTDGLSPAGLTVPAATTLLNPLPITLIDRDGTRHRFTVKDTGGAAGVPVAAYSSSLSAFVGAVGVGPLVPQVLTGALDGTHFPTVCSEAVYQAPPGVHLGLWRYVATTNTGSTPCSGLSDGNAMLLGFGAERPDRLRTEYSWDGKLLSLQDAAGVELRYGYGADSAGLPALPTAPTTTLPTIGALSVVYEPTAACTVARDSSSNRLRVTPATCRALTFAYPADPNGAASCPVPAGATDAVCVTDPAGRKTSYGLTGSPASLVNVTNPDSSVLRYTYAGVAGTAACGAASTGQMCSASDLNNNLSTFTYSTPPAWAAGGPGWVSQLSNRRATSAGGLPFTVSYPSSSQTVTTQGSHVVDLSSIDGAGEVGEAKISDTSSNLYNDTVTGWDLTAGSCIDAGLAPANPIDRNPCTVTRKPIGGVGAADAVTHNSYNPDGMLLVAKRDLNTAGTLSSTVTSGYSTQYADLTGHRSSYPDTLNGNGVVSHGGGTRPANGAVLYTLEDLTSTLTPRGNAPGATAANYLTSYTVDNLPGTAPNTAPVSVCSAGTATGNTGLVCQQSSPNPTGSGLALSRYSYDINGARTTMSTPLLTAGGTCPGGNSTYTYSYYDPAATDLSGLTSSTGWLAGVTDPCGHFTASAYDRAGNRVREWDRDATQAAALPLSSYPGTLSAPPSSSYTETLYGSAGETASISAPWRYPVISRDQSQAVAVSCFDAGGHLLISRSARALSPLNPGACTSGTATFDTVSSYAADDQAVSVKTPAETVATSYSYDGYGQRTAVTRPAGDVKVTVFDAAGRPSKTRWTRAAANDSTPNTPDAACTPGTTTGAGDAPLPTGRVLCEASTIYDGRNNVLSSYDAAGGRSDTSYDLLDRAGSHTLWRTATSTLISRASYDLDGHPTDVCGPRDLTEGAAAAGSACSATSYYGTHRSYNTAGMSTTAISYRVPTGTADGALSGAALTAATLTVSTTYDADGNVLTVTDPNGNAAVTPYVAQTRTYSVLDRLSSSAVQRDSSHANTTSYRYSASGDTLSTTGPAPAGQQRITAYSYDAQHRVVDHVTGSASTDAATAGVAGSDGGSNVRTRTFYDADGNTIAVLTPNAFSGSVTSPDTRYLTRTNVDPDGRPIATFQARTGGSVTDPLGGTPAADCNTTLAGQATAELAAGQPTPPGFGGASACVSKVSYDANSRVATVTPAASSSGPTTVRYTDDDLRAAVLSPNPAGSGTVTSVFQYDGAGRRTLVGQPLQTSAVTHHNLDGTVKDTWTPTGGGAVTATSYNAEGAPTDVTNPLGQISHVEYNSDATVARSTDSTWQLPAAQRDITSYNYDSNGNALTVASPSANAADATNTAGAPTKNSYSYDNLLASTETPNKITAGALSSYRRADYGYDEAGRRTSTHTYLETVAGATVTATPGGDAGTQALSYYPDDRTTVQTGRTTATITTPGTITTTYEPAGKPTLISDSTATPASTLSASYYLDGLTRTVDDGTAGSAGHTSSYAYNGQGQPTARRDAPDNGTGTITNATYTYNSASLPSSATQPALNAATPLMWAYDTDGRLSKTTLPAGTANTITDRTYNLDNTLLEHKTTAAGVLVADYAYTYDALARLSTQTMNAATSAAGGGAVDGQAYSYSYDDAGRVKSFQRGASTALAAVYDHDSNRTSYGTAAATFNPDDSLATSNALPVTEDAFGGVSNDGCHINTFDTFDRTATVTPTGTLACPLAGGTAAYSYDGMDRQRSRTYSAAHGRTAAGAVTASHYDGMTQTLTADVTAAAPDLTYQLDPNGTPDGVSDGTTAGTNYLIGDGAGHTTTTVDQTGTLSCTARFDPFGTPQNAQTGDNVCNSGSTPNETWYAGTHRDSATGTYQLGSRTYNPATSSYAQPDTFRTGDPAGNPSAGMDPLTANTYSYVNGDPVNGSDPSGHGTENQYYGASNSNRIENAQCDKHCLEAQNTSLQQDAAAKSKADAQHKSDHQGWFASAVSSAVSIAKTVAPFVAAVVVGVTCEVPAIFATAGAATVGCAVLAGAAYGAVDGALNCGSVGCVAQDVAIGAASGLLGGVAAKAGGAILRAVAPKLTATVTGAVRSATESALSAIKGALPTAGRGAAESAADAGGSLRAAACGLSFTATTRVVLANGQTKTLKDTQPGDLVRTRDTKTGELRAQSVAAVLINHDHDLLDVIVADARGTQSVLHTTASHPIWDQTSSTWVRAGHLTPGHHLDTANHGDATVRGLITPAVTTSDMWDLTVNTDHDFYVMAGKLSLLVHNCGEADAEAGGAGWRVGDDVYTATKAGNSPAWSTVRGRFWKNTAADPKLAGQWDEANLARMQSGRAPQRFNPDKGGMESMELSHEPIPFRDGGAEFVPRWPQDHAAVDPFRFPGY